MTPPRRISSVDQLYRDNVDVMYRFAYRLCGEAEAADLVQETFLNAYRLRPRFPRGLAGLDLALCHCSHACQRMRRKRKGNRNESYPLTEFIPTSEGEFSHRSPCSDPRGSAGKWELRQILDRAIVAAAQYRMVLVLRDMEGWRQRGRQHSRTERACAIKSCTPRPFVCPGRNSAETA